LGRRAKSGHFSNAVKEVLTMAIEIIEIETEEDLPPLPAVPQ
jgi:hypothetical protein